VKKEATIAAVGALLMLAVLISAARTGGAWFGVRAEFLLFALTLAGVALLHQRTLEVAACGLLAVVLLKVLAPQPFDWGAHLRHEASILLNLFGLLIGFAVLARQFEVSRVPDWLPQVLPARWYGGLCLLVLVFVLSSFLDNIAGALIGGTIARHVYRDRVHLGFLTALVAAANAGGAGSVLGDTTTTMMWIAGVDAGDVLHAYLAAGPALLVFGVAAALQQHRLQPVQDSAVRGVRVDSQRLLAVVLILVGAVAANLWFDFPALGVWAAILLALPFAPADWRAAREALKGSLFLLSLVLTASLMPVQELPPPSWRSAFSLGLVSAVFDNIPLTKLALDQGGYDWGMLAYAVGFGGSMLWFGSSAGVAIAGLYPQARSAAAWLRQGWHVVLAYLVGFAVLLAVQGWRPLAIPGSGH
jgi:hypothetical protein